MNESIAASLERSGPVCGVGATVSPHSSHGVSLTCSDHRTPILGDQNKRPGSRNGAPPSPGNLAVHDHRGGIHTCFLNLVNALGNHQGIAGHSQFEQ
jgi:hypothetical protein